MEVPSQLTAMLELGYFDNDQKEDFPEEPNQIGQFNRELRLLIK